MQFVSRMDTHLLWSSNCSCTAWRCCINPMRFTYSSLKTCYSYLRCTFFFSFLTDTFSWRNTLTVLDAMLKQLPVTFPFTILFSTQSAYALSPFLIPHLPFNPPHSRFCSYNIAKSLYNQQMVSKLLYSMVSQGLQHIQYLDSIDSVPSKLMAPQTSFLLLPTHIAQD